MTDLNFENEFEFEDEDFASLDAILLDLADDIVRDEERTQILNIEKVSTIEKVYRCLKKLLVGQNAQVTCRLNDPVPSMGVVSVIGRDIKINGEVFAAVARIASNTEIYPRTDDTIQLNLTFHNITNILE